MLWNKSHPVKDKELLAAFRTEFDRCQACGYDWWSAHWAFDRKPECHHIIKAGRSDERCNLIMLCMRCHLLAEGHTIRIVTAAGRVKLPILTLGHILWFKALSGDWDPIRLTELYHRPLPTPQKLSEEEFLHLTSG